MSLYRRQRFQPSPNLLDLGWKIVVARIAAWLNAALEAPDRDREAAA
jgi:hypothetical protein